MAAARKTPDVDSVPSAPAGPYRVETFRAGESIGYLIKRVRSAHAAAVDKEVAKFDLSHEQCGILVMIAHQVGVTAADLSREWDCDTGSMTRMIDRLEAKELVRRTRRAGDRRRVPLELTEAGRELADQVPPVFVSILNRSLSGFSASEVDTLEMFLQRMLKNIAPNHASRGGSQP